jgi:5'-3' exonuclease
MKYALVDTANTFFRSKYVAARCETAWEKVGMALHLTMHSVNHIVRKFGIDHVVFCLEGRSWRKDFYYPYKRNRIVDSQSVTEKELEEEKLFNETYNSLVQYLTEKTNCSVIRIPNAEADDVVARFIALHPQDECVIISTDTDFYQLIGEHVKQYNGVAKRLVTIDGIFDDRDRPVMDKKTKEPMKIGDPKFVLFEKCVRGDSSDNIFSAYPGAPTKGTSKRVGLIEAFQDKHRGGFEWNNFMLQRWTDVDGVEHCVKDDYERNRVLIDLSAQPDEIKNTVDATIKASLKKAVVSQVGSYFMKFCGKYDLVNLSDNATQFSKWLNSPYTGTYCNGEENVAA